MQKNKRVSSSQQVKFYTFLETRWMDTSAQKRKVEKSMKSEPCRKSEIRVNRHSGGRMKQNTWDKWG